MPIKETAYKSVLSGSVGDFLNSKKVEKGASADHVEFLNVLDFIEKFKLLPFGLYPVQRFIVKMYYNIPLDNVDKTIEVRDMFGTKILYKLTEVEYLKYLYDKGCCNIREQDGKDRRELILVLGRRSGKSALSSLFASYELYKLLCRGHPQHYYGMPDGSEIRVICVANDKDQAGIVYGDMQGHIEAVDYFKSAIANTTQTFMKFRTEHDKTKFGACLVGSTLVYTNHGLVRLDSLSDVHEPETWSQIDVTVAQEGTKARSDAVGFFAAGRKATRKITTYHGYEINGSFEHKVKTLRPDGTIDWCEFKDLGPGDLIAINRNIGLWPSEQIPTSHFISLSESKLRESFRSNLSRFAEFIHSLECPVEMNRKDLSRKLNINHHCLRHVLDYLEKSGNTFKETVRHRQFGLGGTVRWLPTRLVYSDALDTNRSGKIQFPDELDNDWGRLLGILTGDGTWNYDGSIQVTGGCPEFLEYLKKMFTNMFGSYTYTNDRTERTRGDDPWNLRVHSVQLRRFLTFLGYGKSTPSTKYVPAMIMKSPKNVVASFLSGLFETDGTVTKDGAISYTTASHRLASEVQLLLLNFGIVTRLSTKHNKKYGRNYYQVSLVGSRSNNTFISEIGFLTVRKNGRLKPRAVEDDISIPGLKLLLKNVVASVPKATRAENLRTQLVRIAGYGITYESSSISYTRLRKFVEKAIEFGGHGAELEKLKSILDTDYLWDPIMSVEDSDNNVFDINVPEGNHYIAQGFTSHNSGKATVSATFKSSVAKGLRGRGVMCAILDEIAFFVDDGQTSGEKVYKALMPALAQFSPKDPVNKHISIGPTEGRMILISSPDAKEGFFYRMYQMALSNDKGASDMLMIQAPTWEVNPTLDRSYYEKEYFKDPRTFITEHGAQFSDRVRGWIEDSSDLNSCINFDAVPRLRGVPKEAHFAGVDVGLVNDGTSVALTRINDGKIELVYHEIWYAKKRWADANPHLKEPLTPYAKTLQDVTRLDMHEIALWLKALSQRFYITKGIFDQWSGIVFEQELHKNGLKQFEIRNFFASESSQMYQTFKMFMYANQLSLYDFPKPELINGETYGRRSPLIQELLELQAYANGKNIITVEAPRVPGKHDDMSDALARSVLLASEYISANPGILDRKTSLQTPMAQSITRSPTYAQYHRERKKMMGGNGGRRVAARTPPRLPR